MPKSRGRRRKTGHTTPRRARRSIDEERARAVANLPVLQAIDRAEASGDALMTLELIEQDLADREDDNFWRPERLRRLVQLALFEGLLPRWATSRWILEQAAQSLDRRGRDRALKAIEIAVSMQGGEGNRVGTDRLDFRVQLIDHDWVFRQLLLYEFGALQFFVSRIASPKLLAGADRIHEWARTPMGGFRLVRESPRTLVWQDLGTGEELESLNLGTAWLLDLGECALGRLVPIESGAMFETAPLFVPERVARQVAADPSDWVAALSEECRSQHPEDPQVTTGGHSFPLLTDVPLAAQAMVARSVSGAGTRAVRAPHPLTGAPDPVAEQAAVVRAALDGMLDEHDLGVCPWPVVAASLLEPSVFLEIARTFLPADGSKFDRLAAVLTAPADAVCRELARDAGRAA